MSSTGSTTEQQVRDELGRELDVVVPPPGDLRAVVGRGRRLRGRRRAAGAGAVLAAAAAVTVAAVLVPSGDGSSEPEPDPGPATGAGPVEPVVPDDLGPGWHPVTAPPAAPLPGVLAGSTGTELLLVGGRDEQGRPVATGQAFDLARGTWRTIASAPQGLDDGDGGDGGDATSVVVGDRLVVATSGGLVAYDASEDAWSDLADPPEPLAGATADLVAGVDGSTLFTPARSGRILELDLASQRWDRLPVDDLDLPETVESVDSLVAVPGGLAVSVVLEGSRSGGYPIYVDVWDGTAWSRLPSGQAVGFSHWTGERLLGVGLDPIEVDGLRPTLAGTLGLDGSWSPVEVPVPSRLDDPRAIADVEGGQGDHGVGEGPLLLTGSRLYDDATGDWQDLTAPPGASTQPYAAQVAGGDVYLVGGIDDDGRTIDQVWVFVP